MGETVNEQPGRLGRPVQIRFPEDLAAKARFLAGQQDMTAGAWIRRIVDRELAAQSGRCPACGSAVETETPPQHR